MANQPKKYKKFVATAATATLVASAIVPVASAASFSDVSENNEFAPYIDALTEAGIINGYPSTNTFKPGASLTRGQVVKMLGRWVESNGVEIPSDWNTKARFTDVPTNHKDQELVKYAALVADEGVFGGAAGKLMAGNNITRQQMAKVLNGAYAAVNGESLIEIAEGVDNVRIPDLSSARAEFEDAIQALMDLEISSTNSGNFRPLENVTRAQFSKFLYNTINFEAVDVAPFEIKAVNNTTVEVIFEDEIENIDKVKFEIDGLKVTNAVVKQTSKRTAVLTTESQKGGTEYAVTVDGEKAGTFVGIAAVIPTDIKHVVSSIQAKNGEKVTVQAQVTVPEGQDKAGIPVTFNVYTGVNNDTAINPQIIGEAVTNAEGVATYSYTRYNGEMDYVDAYATGAPAKKATAQVYWNSSLKIADVTTEATLQNGAKKVYQVTGTPGSTVYVTFAENLNVTPDKAVTGAKFEGIPTVTLDATTGALLTGTTAPYPYEFTTGGKAVGYVTLDANGKANVVVSGTNAAVTPVVYSIPTSTTSKAYRATALQAKGSKVTFQQTQILGLTLTAEGKQNAAVRLADPQIGGRDYVAKVTTANGSAAVLTPVVIAFKNTTTNNFGTLELYKADGTRLTKTTSGDTVYFTGLSTDATGQAKFTVTNSLSNSFATPFVFVDNGTNTGILDAADLQQAGEITYFSEVSSSQYTSKLKLTTAANQNKEATTFGVNDTARFAYQLSDQNGKPRSYGTPTTVTFQVTNNGSTPINVANTTTGETAIVQPGQSATYNRTVGAGSVETALEISSTGATYVNVIATPSNPGLALGQASATATFAGGSATPSFVVSPADQTTGSAATADTVTFTFTENVTPANVSVVKLTGTGAGSTIATQNSPTNAKVLFATFAPNSLVTGDRFQISYAGKVYVFELRPDGTFLLK